MNRVHFLPETFCLSPDMLDSDFLNADPLTVHFVFSRKLSLEEIRLLKAFAEKFISTWQAHGKPLEASCLFTFSQIFSVLVNEKATRATGCSKDALFRAVAQWAAQHAIPLAPRSHIPVVEGDNLRLADFKECRQLSGSTVIVDISSSCWSSFRDGFMVSASHTPLRDLFNMSV